MNPTEAGRVLAKAAAFDQRKVGEADVRAWFEAIGDLPYPAALEAVGRYYADNRERIMPADVRWIVEDMARRQAEAARPDPLEAGGRAASPRGARIVGHVLAGLAAARRAAGGRLPRGRAVELGEQLMAEALRRYPAEAAPATQQWGGRCPRPDCLCTHGFDPVAGGVCDRGWIEVAVPASAEVQVRPCHTCWPERAKALRGDRSAAVRRLRAGKT